jgi:diacylglycerol O-acyltransferase
MERLSGLDASFLYLETPTHHMHVAVTMTFDPTTVPGGYSFERMKASIAERIPQAPVFRRRLVEVPFRLGHPVWVEDPHFDIDAHIRLAALPRPGGLRQLADLVGEIAGHQLDRARPLWEMWIVEGLSRDRIGVVAKMHHATIDGVSGAALLSVLFDLEPDAGPGAPSPDMPVDDRVPSALELVSQAVVARSLRPIELTADLVRTGRRLLDVRRLRTGPEHSEPRSKAALPLSAPRTSFNAPLSRRRNVALSAIGLDDVKRLKNATGTTVNDVVLAVATGALRTFLQGGDELPDRPLVAVVPVSVRPDLDAARGSNQVSAMFVHLPVELDDPVDRLAAIHEGTRGAKDEFDALGADILLNWAEHATPNVFAGGARVYSAMRLSEHHRPVANLVMSNVPGPAFPLYLAGAELDAGYPLGPVMEGMGVNITVMSYQGILSWGIIGCPETIPRIWDLAAAVPTALDDLLAAADLAPATYRSADAAEAVGAGATAMDEAPEHTAMGRPKVPEAGP